MNQVSNILVRKGTCVPVFSEIDVVVHPRRFILVCVTLSGESTWHVVTGPAYLLGPTLLNEFIITSGLYLEPNPYINVVGGGTLRVDHETNTILVSGISKEYGPVAENHIKHLFEILREYFPRESWEIVRKKHTQAKRSVLK
ncbi:hypothetical protein COW81_03535 [Candidatus Campbellbacteria bacterium CG22_combo_CG10-13_8_21_14_all_36_13]|uniref:Uncharacterized protein n=1 Tax=Candidatus Campbellbacteria bacterium CG22_combo_CG10-13_8_21_14_all_36_13 TaxID=1974529 RepID=A0A2H0DY78_9BACT|nr:MAG: hypothetical protein COW81_03535 [Candidatus Campbellbacteria bacterium CG22_combo_CG10-13_8_21_14_all_36_13]